MIELVCLLSLKKWSHLFIGEFFFIRSKRNFGWLNRIVRTIDCRCALTRHYRSKQCILTNSRQLVSQDKISHCLLTLPPSTSYLDGGRRVNKTTFYREKGTQIWTTNHCQYNFSDNLFNISKYWPSENKTRKKSFAKDKIALKVFRKKNHFEKFHFSVYLNLLKIKIPKKQKIVFLAFRQKKVRVMQSNTNRMSNIWIKLYLCKEIISRKLIICWKQRQRRTKMAWNVQANVNIWEPFPECYSIFWQILLNGNLTGEFWLPVDWRLNWISKNRRTQALYVKEFLIFLVFPVRGENFFFLKKSFDWFYDYTELHCAEINLNGRQRDSNRNKWGKPQWKPQTLEGNFSLFYSKSGRWSVHVMTSMYISFNPQFLKKIFLVCSKWIRPFWQGLQPFLKKYSCFE